MISFLVERTSYDFDITSGQASYSNLSIASFKVYEFFTRNNFTIIYYKVESPTFLDFS